MTAEQVIDAQQAKRDERETQLDRIEFLVNYLRQNPDIPLPMQLKEREFTIYSLRTKEQAAQIAKTFGTCRKDVSDNAFNIIKELPAIECTIRAHFSRGEICERIVTGTRIEPEKIIPAQIVPEQEVEIVEWRCAPILDELENIKSE